MVTALDTKFRALATRLIGNATAQTHLLKRVSKGYNPVVGSNTLATVSASVAKSPSFPFDERYVDGSTVLATDFYCMVAAEALEAASLDPTPGDDVEVTLTVDGTVFRVMAAKKFSADLALAYELHLRA